MWQEWLLFEKYFYSIAYVAIDSVHSRFDEYVHE